VDLEQWYWYGLTTTVDICVVLAIGNWYIRHALEYVYFLHGRSRPTSLASSFPSSRASSLQVGESNSFTSYSCIEHVDGNGAGIVAVVSATSLSLRQWGTANAVLCVFRDWMGAI